jgi:hypothetical protein
MKGLGLVLIVGVTLTAAVVAIFGLWREEGPATANPSLVVGVDMDPYGTPANTCPGNGSPDCTVGSIESCVSVPKTCSSQA